MKSIATGAKVILLLGATLDFNPAYADNCSGYDSFVQTTVHTADLGKGMTLTILEASSIVTSGDSKYNLVTGGCSGTVLSNPDGTVQSSGYCARRDKDGDLSSLEWMQAAGSDKGTWKATGGTGKFAGKGDTGWYQSVVSDGKIGVSKWGGNCR